MYVPDKALQISLEACHATLEWEVLRVGETDVELECFAPNGEELVVEGRAYLLHTHRLDAEDDCGLHTSIESLRGWEDVWTQTKRRVPCPAVGVSSEVSRTMRLNMVGLMPASTYVAVVSVSSSVDGMTNRSSLRRTFWFPFCTLSLATFVRCMDRSDSTLRLTITRPDTPLMLPEFMRRTVSPSPVTMADDAPLRQDVPHSPVGPMTLIASPQAPFFEDAMSGKPRRTQVFQYHCRATVMTIPGREMSEELFANRSQERTIAIGEVSVRFEGLFSETLYQCDLVSVERVSVGSTSTVSSPSPSMSGQARFSVASPSAVSPFGNLRIDAMDGSSPRGAMASPTTGDGDASLEPMRRATRPTPSFRQVFGRRSSPCYVHTLPKVVALVESLTAQSASLSIMRTPSPFSTLELVLSMLTATQRSALLATGGADEPVAVVARIAKRRMAQLMSLRRGSAGSRTSRSMSITGSVQRGQSVLSDPELGTTLMSHSGYGASDDSNSDLSSSDEDDDDSDLDDVMDGQDGDKKGKGASSGGNGGAGKQDADGKQHGHHGEHGDDRPKRETGDMLIIGIATKESPFVVDGLQPNQAYSIHFYTYALSSQEMEEWKLKQEALEMPLNGSGVPQGHELEDEGHDPDSIAGRSSYTVDKNRYIGRSLIVTPSMQRPLSITALVVERTTGAKRNSSMGNIKSTASNSSHQLNLLNAGTPDDGYIQNDVAVLSTLQHTMSYRQDDANSVASPASASRVPGSPKRTSIVTKGLSQLVTSEGAEGMGSPASKPVLDSQFNDIAKQEAIATIARTVFKYTNPCVDGSVRAITENGGELCFVTDFKRTADRLLYRRQQLGEDDRDDELGQLPSYLLDLITRSEVMACASSIRRSVKFLYCLRVLVLPRGEYSTDTRAFASPVAELPMPKLTWDQIDELCRRPSQRIETEHKIRFQTKYTTHGLPLLVEQQTHVDRAGGSPRSGGGALTNTGSMLLSHDALELLQRTQSQLSVADRVKNAFDHNTSSNNNLMSPNMDLDITDDSGRRGRNGVKSPISSPRANAGAMSPRQRRSSLEEHLKSPLKQPTVSIVEATVREYVFACSHSKYRLPPLDPDTRYLISVCGIAAPERPDDYAERLAAFEARKEEQRLKKEREEQEALVAAMRRQEARLTSFDVTEGDVLDGMGSDGFSPTAAAAQQQQPMTAESSSVAAIEASPSPPMAFAAGLPRIVVREVDEFTVGGSSTCSSPFAHDSQSDPSRSTSEDAEEALIFGPHLDWLQWSPCIPIMTSYVPKTVQVEYVHGDGFRFVLNPSLAEVEVANCGSDPAALAHVLGAHTQQNLQKFLSAELSCLDDARYNRSVLLDRDITHASGGLGGTAFEFPHSLKFDGRYQLRVRVGELPSANALQRAKSGVKGSGSAPASKMHSPALTSLAPSGAPSGAASESGEPHPHPPDGAEGGAGAELEEYLKFGAYGPTVDFVMCYGNVADVEEIERGLRCYLHPPYLNAHKTEFCMRARKSKLTASDLGVGVTEIPSSFVHNIARERENSTNSGSGISRTHSSSGANKFLSSSGDDPDDVKVLHVCGYTIVGCGSTGVYSTYPVSESELRCHVAMLRNLRPDTYNVSVRYFVVLSQSIPAWRFGGRIQQNAQRQRSRSATFEQPGNTSSSAAAGGGAPHRVRSNSLTSVSQSLISTHFGSSGGGGGGTEDAHHHKEQKHAASGAGGDGEGDPTIQVTDETGGKELVHEDNAVVKLGRRHTLAVNSTRLSSVMTARIRAEESILELSAQVAAGRRAGATMPQKAAPKVVTALHSALRNSTRYDIGTGTVYRRHEILPLKVGEHFVTLTTVVSSAALFEMLVLDGAIASGQLHASPTTRSGYMEELTSFLTASQQFSAGLGVGSSSPSPSPRRGHDHDTAGELLDDAAEVVHHDEYGGTGEVLLGMHECPYNDFAEPVFSRRGKPLRYPTLPPDVNVLKLTTTQEHRMNKFLNEYLDDMERMQITEMVANMGSVSQASLQLAAGGGQPSGGGAPSSSSEPAGTPAVVGSATQDLSSTGAAAAAMTGLATQLMKRGDLSPAYQQFRRDITSVQVEVTLASDHTTKKSRSFSYTPQLTTSLTIPQLEPGTEYRLRLRVQGRYNSALGATPNWSRWTLPIRVTTQERLVISTTFATESSILLRWVREKALADDFDGAASAMGSNSMSNYGDKSGGDRKKSRAIAMDARVISGCCDHRRYIPALPSADDVTATSNAITTANTNNNAITSDASASPPQTSKNRKSTTRGDANGGGGPLSYLGVIFTNSLPFEIEVSLIDNSDGLPTRGEGGGSKHRQSLTANAKKRKGEGTILQQCRLFVPAFLGGMKLKDCYPGMKYFVRLRTTTNKECDAAMVASNPNGTPSAAGGWLSSVTASSLSPAAVPTTGGETGLRRRRTSILAATRGLSKDDSSMGAGSWSSKVQVSTLSDVVVTMLKLGASYCSFRIDKLAADVDALRSEIESSAGSAKMIINEDILGTDKTSSATQPAAGVGGLGKKTPPPTPQAAGKTLSPSNISVPATQSQQHAHPIQEADAAHHAMLARMSHYEVRCRPASPWLSEFDLRRQMRERAAKEADAETLSNEDRDSSPLNPFLAGLDMHPSLLVQWRRPTLQNLEPDSDVVGSAKAGPVGDPSAKLREVTLSSLKPGCMYVLSIRPNIVGQFAGQWVEMLRFCTSPVPSPNLVCTCEDQVLFRWTEPRLRHITILNQDSARATERLERQDRDSASLNSSMSSVQSPRGKPHDDLASQDSSSMQSSSMVLEGPLGSGELLHGPIPFQIDAVEIEVQGVFCDVNQRRLGSTLKDIKAAAKEVTLTRCLDLSSRLRERLMGRAKELSSSGNKSKGKDKKGRSFTREAGHSSSPPVERLAPSFSTADLITPFYVTVAPVFEDARSAALPAVNEGNVSGADIASRDGAESAATGEDSPRNRGGQQATNAAAPLCLALELLLENAFPDSTYVLRVRYRDNNGIWSPQSDPWTVLTHPTLATSDIGLGESYAVLRTQRMPRSVASLQQLEYLRDWLLLEHDRKNVADRARETLNQRLALVERYGDEAGPDDINEESGSMIEEDFMGKEQLLAEIDLLSFELGKMHGVTTAPVCISAYLPGVSKTIDFMHRDLLSRRTRRFKFANTDTNTSYSPMLPAGALDATAAGASPESPSSFPSTSLMSALGITDTLGVIDDERLYDPQHYTVELSVIRKSAVDARARPSRQYLFGNTALLGTLSSFDPLEALQADECDVPSESQSTESAIVKRESTDLISVSRLLPAVEYLAVTRVNSGAPEHDDTEDVDAFMAGLMDEGDARGTAGHSSTTGDNQAPSSNSPTDKPPAQVEPLFFARRCCSFFDPGVEVSAFSCGMWSDPLAFVTLPQILVRVRAVGFTEMLFEVFRPLHAEQTIPGDDVYEANSARANRYISSKSRSSTSNAYQLSINGKYTPLSDMQSFYKGEKKLLHLYKLPQDSQVVVACRCRFSLDEFLRELERYPDTAPQARTMLRPETLARRKNIVFWSNWVTLVQQVRTLPPRPSIPVLYEARSMPKTSFAFEGGRPPSESEWADFVSFWWSVQADSMNHFPVEIQMDSDAEMFERRRGGRSGSHTTAETVLQSMPTTFLSHQSKMIQVLLDPHQEQLNAIREAMIEVAERFPHEDVVSLQDPRGLNGLSEPLFPPMESSSAVSGTVSPAPPGGDETHSDATKGQQFTGMAFDGPSSEYSFEVEMAEYNPELTCFSEFYPIGRMRNTFLRLQLPQTRKGDTRVQIERCMFRLRSRVEAVDAPDGCVRSFWSPIVSWRRPAPPPSVMQVQLTPFPEERQALLQFTYPTQAFHNQIVYEVVHRESMEKDVPPPHAVGALSRIQPHRDSPVMLGPLHVQRFHHIAVRAVTTFGRSEWSRWHSLRLDGTLSSEKSTKATGTFTAMMRAAGGRRPSLNDEDLDRDEVLRREAAIEAYHHMTESEWDSKTAWQYPFPLSRATDGFPCPKDSCFHYSIHVQERAMRRADPEQTVHLDAFPQFIASKYLGAEYQPLHEDLPPHEENEEETGMGTGMLALRVSPTGRRFSQASDDVSSEASSSQLPLAMVTNGSMAPSSMMFERSSMSGGAAPSMADSSCVAVEEPLVPSSSLLPPSAVSDAVRLRKGRVTVMLAPGPTMSEPPSLQVPSVISPPLVRSSNVLSPLLSPVTLSSPSKHRESWLVSPSGVEEYFPEPTATTRGGEKDAAKFPPVPLDDQILKDADTATPSSMTPTAGLMRNPFAPPPITMQAFLNQFIPPKPPLASSQTGPLVPAVYRSQGGEIDRGSRPTSTQGSPRISRSVSATSIRTHRGSDASANSVLQTAADKIFQKEDPFERLRMLSNVVLPGSVVRGYREQRSPQRQPQQSAEPKQPRRPTTVKPTGVKGKPEYTRK